MSRARQLLLLTGVLLAACRRQPSASTMHPDASVVAAASPWSEDALRARLVEVQLAMLRLHDLKAQPAPPGRRLVGMCGEQPATTGPSAAAVDRAAGPYLGGEALECLVDAYWGCRLGDTIGVADARPDEQELVVHTRSKVRMVSQSSDRVSAEVGLVPWSCVSRALEHDDHECPDPPLMVPVELAKGPDAVWRVVKRGACKARPGRVVDPVFALAAVAGLDGPSAAVGELAGGPALLRWSSPRGASARYEAPAPVLVQAVALAADPSECELGPARVLLDGGESFDLAAPGRSFATHPLTPPRRVRTITIEPTGTGSSTDDACLGHLMVVASP